jgi:signal transduction histidine kinase
MRKELVTLIAYRSARRLAVFPSVFLRNGLVENVSNQFMELTGYAENEFLYENEDDLLSKLRANFSIADFRSKDCLYIFSKNLEPREIEVIAYDEHEESQLFFVEKQDSRLGQALPYVEHQLRYNLIGTALFSADNFILLNANQLFLDILDEPFNMLDHSIGKSLHEICTGWTGSASNALWQHVVDSGEPFFSKEFVYEGLSKGTIYTDIMIVPVVTGGKVKYLVVTARDVTEDVLNRKLIDSQAQLLVQQKDRLENLLSSLSHELRNPLATITAGVTLIDKQETGLKSRETLEIVKRQTSHLRRLIDDLLDIARISKNKIHLKKEPFDLNALALSVFSDHQILFRERGIEFGIYVDDEPLVITADQVRIAQSIGNMLHNSLKFSRPGGKAVLSVMAYSSHVFITVQDNGVGIDACFLPKLFEAFSQADNSLDRQNGGLGLGLTIVKSIAELHGGTATAYSNGPGQGAQVTIILPLRGQ